MPNRLHRYSKLASAFTAFALLLGHLPARAEAAGAKPTSCTGERSTINPLDVGGKVLYRRERI